MTAHISAHAHLEQARSEWPQALVPASAFARFSSVAPKLPEPLTGLFAECHLSHPTRTDLVGRVSRANRDEALDTGRCPERLRPFFTLWRDPESPAFEIRTVDIECDLAESHTEPFLCPNLEPSVLAGVEGIERRARRERAANQEPLALSLSWSVLRALDPGISPGLLAALDRSARALPPYGVIIPGWPSRARPGSGSVPFLRAGIAMPRAALRRYLESVGWRGDIPDLLQHVDLLMPSGPWAGIDIDIFEEGVGPRIGIYQEHWWVRPSDTDLADTIDRLDRLSFCVPSRLDGFRAWVSARPESAAPGEARSLSLKLVYSGDQPPAVKVYLSTFDEAQEVRSFHGAPRPAH